MPCIFGTSLRACSGSHGSARSHSRSTGTSIRTRATSLRSTFQAVLGSTTLPSIETPTKSGAAAPDFVGVSIDGNVVDPRTAWNVERKLVARVLIDVPVDRECERADPWDPL